MIKKILFYLISIGVMFMLCYIIYILLMFQGLGEYHWTEILPLEIYILLFCEFLFILISLVLIFKLINETILDKKKKKKE